ncbi:MAG: DeoR/GlpR family DNA-binding transcription regulator [Oscillospiraceae bacterium]|jgi:DeoR/GlpR family transcriptional regulator of sugar metabolism|nr:DeoR/GlpR family DNA-binding transcription regulator [Oscillospiraceae bacterium]
MLAAERKNLILERLRAEGSVFVVPLSEEFGVSEETIRRDLEKLEREGRAQRSYGGALYSEDERADPPYNVRRYTNIPGKERIAQLTAQLIDDGDFIMFDESTTAGFVARALKDKQRLTVITNSIETVVDLQEMSDWTVLCTGGSLKKGVLALTGHQAESFIRDYHVDKAIISCTALDIDAGYTDAGEDNALIKRAIMASADKTILVCDGHKFGKRAFTRIGSLDRLYALVTDAEPDEVWKAALAEQGVKLYS